MPGGSTLAAEGFRPSSGAADATLPPPLVDMKTLNLPSVIVDIFLAAGVTKRAKTPMRREKPAWTRMKRLILLTCFSAPLLWVMPRGQAAVGGRISGTVTDR